jgi:hypothetical protein
VSVDIDDVIVAWPVIIDALGPMTKAAMREAQPLSYENNVLTLGIAPAHLEAAIGRLKNEADNIRNALRDRLGISPKFQPVAHEGFGTGSAARPATTAPAADEGPIGEPPLDDEPPPDDDAPPAPSAAPAPPAASAPAVPAFAAPDPDDDYVAPDEIIHTPVDASIDSVGLFTKSFDATVVEEVTRD